MAVNDQAFPASVWLLTSGLRFSSLRKRAQSGCCPGRGRWSSLAARPSGPWRCLRLWSRATWPPGSSPSYRPRYTGPLSVPPWTHIHFKPFHPPINVMMILIMVCVEFAVRLTGLQRNIGINTIRLRSWKITVRLQCFKYWSFGRDE